MGTPELTGVYRPTGRVSKWTIMFLTLALAGGFVACSDDKEPESGGSEDCTDGDTDTVVCGDNDEGTQKRICVDGAWQNDGACSTGSADCTDGDTDIVACGEDGDKAQARICVDGQWQNDGDCKSVDTSCTDGDTNTVACGPDDKGEQDIVCVDGKWESAGACVDPNAECTAGENQTIDCGLNNRGEQAQVCEDGQWSNLGGCSDTDVCVDGSTRNVGCGTNGLMAQNCDAGQWVDAGSCVESCVDGDTDTTSCGLNDNGTQNLVCDSGDWINDGACNDPDNCIIGERRTVACSSTGEFGTINEKCEDDASGADWQKIGSCVANSIDMHTKHACAVRNDGKVLCWGDNSAGQLGDGTTDSSTTPVEVDGISNASRVAVGQEFSCAVTDNGEVYCWGSNSQGQLGNSSDVDSRTPVKVQGLANARSIAAGRMHACVVTTDHDVYCWGWNRKGQLGIDSTNDRWTPEQALNLPDISQVYAGSETTCALKSPGLILFQTTPTDAYCWGDNTYYQAGITGESAEDEYLTPVKVPGEKFLGISIHRRAFCGTITTGNVTRVECLGGGSSFSPEQGDGDGQAGVYNSFHVLSPDVRYTIPLLQNIYPYPVPKAGGDVNKGNVCAIVPADNEVWCWGNNQLGALGRGYSGTNGGGAIGDELARLATPEPVKTERIILIGGSFQIVVVDASNQRALAVGEESICTINNGGHLQCTGKMSSDRKGYLDSPGSKPPIIINP